MKKVYLFYGLSASDSPQNIRYVGVTSRSLNDRFSQHKYCANHPEKRCLPVHKWMFSKYNQGLDIICTKIDECFEDEWENREKELIKKYNEGGNLLNVDEGGKGVITVEKRNKDGIQRSIEAHLKPVSLFDKNGNLIDNCKSVNEASEKYKLNRTSIGNVLSGRSKTCGGFYIVETSLIDSDFNIKQYINNLESTCSKRKAVYQFTLDGDLVQKFEGVTKAGEVYGNRNAIKKCIDNKEMYKGYYWSYSNNIDINEFNL